MADGSGGMSAERMNLPRATPPTNHGHTVAAWVTVAVVLAGAVLATVAVVFTAWTWFWVGVGLFVVAAVTGLVLRGVGLGQPRPAGPARESPDSGSDVSPAKEQK